MVPNCDRLTSRQKRPARSHQSPPLPPGRAVAAVLETRTSPSKQGRPAVPVHLAPSCSPLPALWAHLTPAGLPGPSALYQTLRHQVLSRLLQAREALRVGSVIMARPHKVEHKGASGPIGTRTCDVVRDGCLSKNRCLAGRCLAGSDTYAKSRRTGWRGVRT